MADTPKYSSIIDEFLDSREPDWKDLGLKDAKKSGDDWIKNNSQPYVDASFMDEIAEGASKHTAMPPTSKGATLHNRMLDKETAAPRLGANRGANYRTAANTEDYKSAVGDDASLMEEVTHSIEEAVKGGKVEKRNRTDGEIQRYVRDLLNQGVTPSKVASQLKKLAEVEKFNQATALSYLKKNAGMMGLAYLEPCKTAEIELYNKKDNMSNAFLNNSDAGGTGMSVLAPNTFMDGNNPAYERTASDSKTAYGFNTQHEMQVLQQLREAGSVVGQISAGDRVTIRTPQGQERSGRAMMFNAQQQCWVLNLGGAHGTPGIADEGNIVRFKKAPKKASGKIAATYKVEQQGHEWYVMGLPQEDIHGKVHPDSFIIPGMNHSMNTPESIASGIYETLYDEFQTNDNLKDGDIFDTPVGQFICQGFHVIPHDDKAKQALESAKAKRDSERHSDDHYASKVTVASSQDCVRQAKAWKAAGVKPRAKSVKQITACTDCSYFKKNGGTKSCGLYGLPVVGNAAELGSVVNRMTAGVPSNLKKAALVQIANRLPEQNIPKSTVSAPMVHQSSFTKERDYGFKEGKHFSGSLVQKAHAKGHSLKTINAAAEKQFGALEASRGIREFVATLRKDKGQIVMAKADADYLKKLGIHNDAIVGAAKCASCKDHISKEVHKAVSAEGVTRASDTFVETTLGQVRGARHTASSHFDSAAVDKYHKAGHSIKKIFKAASAKYGSVQTSKAIHDWASNLKNTNTKIALTQIDCTVLNKMGVKLGSQNPIVGAEKCGSCSYRKGMHCGLTGGTLLSFPGMAQTASNHKVASGAPEDGRSILKEFDLMHNAAQDDIDMNSDRDYDVK